MLLQSRNHFFQRSDDFCPLCLFQLRERLTEDFTPTLAKLVYKALALHRQRDQHRAPVARSRLTLDQSFANQPSVNCVTAGAEIRNSVASLPVGTDPLRRSTLSTCACGNVK